MVCLGIIYPQVCVFNYESVCVCVYGVMIRWLARRKSKDRRLVHADEGARKKTLESFESVENEKLVPQGTFCTLPKLFQTLHGTVHGACPQNIMQCEMICSINACKHHNTRTRGRYIAHAAAQTE